MVLTEEQVQFFNTFGFLVRKNVFTPDEVETYTEEIDRRAAESHALVPYEPEDIGQGGRQHSLLVPSTPFLTSMMEDDRLAGAAEEMCGEIGWIGTTAHQFSGDSVWHFDGGCREWAGVNNLIYTCPVRADSGGLRVLPGSHHWDVHEQVAGFDPLGPEWTRAAATPEQKQRALEAVHSIPCFVCEANPGDVVSFDMQVYHCSFGGGGDRRACTLSFHATPRTPEQIEMAIISCEHSLESHDNAADPWNPTQEFPDEWLANPQGSPRRASWIEHLHKYSQMEKGLQGVRGDVEYGKIKMVRI